MEWLRLDAGFFGHPKVGALARRLGVSRDAAALAVLRVLCWAAQTCEDGDLTGAHEDDIAEAARVPGDPGAFVQALVDAGWIDRDGERLTLHGWAERQAPLLLGRERVRRFRERKRAERLEETGNVTDTAPGNVSETVPYRPTDLPTDLPTDQKRESPTTASLPLPFAPPEPSPAETAQEPAHAPTWEWAASVWRARCGRLGQPRSAPGAAQRRHWTARCKEPGFVEAFDEVCRRIGASDFCAGHNDRGWRADLSWLLERPEAWRKALDGRYDNRAAAKGRLAGLGLDDERRATFAALEAE